LLIAEKDEQDYFLVHSLPITIQNHKKHSAGKETTQTKKFTTKGIQRALQEKKE